MNSPERVAYSAAVCSVVGVALAVGGIGIGFHYFALNQSIPPAVDHIQVSMLLLAALSGIVTILLFAWFIVLLIKQRFVRSGKDNGCST